MQNLEYIVRPCTAVYGISKEIHPMFKFFLLSNKSSAVSSDDGDES